MCAEKSAVDLVVQTVRHATNTQLMRVALVKKKGKKENIDDINEELCDLQVPSFHRALSDR